MRAASSFALVFSLLLLALAVVGCLFGNGYQVYLIAMVCLTAIVGVGLNVLLGLTGQVSLGHVGFFAIGAYAVAILTTFHGVSFWLALPVAVALAGVVGVILALPALRVAGPYLAMVTIAFGFIIENSAIEWRSLTGGANGIVNIPPPAVAGHEFSLREIALCTVALATVILLAFRRLDRSPWGRAMRAVRASELASQCLGLNPIAVRIVAFALSALAAGLAGGLFAPLAGFVSPSGFTFSQSILYLLAVIVGGAGTTLGPLVGAALVVLLPQLLAGLAEYQVLFFGAVLLLVLWLAPEGIVGEIRRRFVAAGPSHRPHERVDVASYLTSAADGATVTARGIGLSFGGVRALSEVDFTAPGGKVTSLIGPNGAGKTTLLNILSGVYRPRAGTITLGEQALTGGAPHAIARAGIARTFQTSQLFAGLSVLDNVRVGVRRHRLGSPIPLGLRRASEEVERQLAESLLVFVGYGEALERPAGDLAHIDKRLVEIARALATGPKVLLLDEPAAGLGGDDKVRLRALLRRLADIGIAVVLIEHDMSLVMDVSDSVVVLDAGRRIAAGAPAEVQNDPAVLAAYLGAGEVTPALRRAPWRGGRELLAARALHAGYDDVEVLRGIDVEVRAGETVAVLGANGAGKTTMMRAFSGLLRPTRGAIELEGNEISALPAHRHARAGVILVPEGRQVFPELSVVDNLLLGACARPSREAAEGIERMLARFPLLRARRAQRAGLLSGGEQQMLALARGLMAGPRVLLLDEPSLGLAPAAIVALFADVATLRDEGVTLLLVDQMAGPALALADRAYVIETGRIVRTGPAAEIAADDALREAYLGGQAQPAAS
ncbi:MAG TPA: branched-chain amino acid ABC transporter ATP-binding protein/permease [Xanthobacteraceae bacterium]|jgi:ABC-type branched-subunit amino acid transport system ATPase component/ABC-type branched-subunit amino acid transport system permease subunit|nr:branched-chain amino acid ABC transporter ATP-binding protein/permease [Xanthobacteraceae bacterium]